MKPISYQRHRFPPDLIRHAVWLYFRFTLSLRDVEALLAERGIEVGYEAIRCWTQKFGVQFARNRRRSRPKPTGRWHLDEMVVRIGGRRMFLWRAVDDEGEVLDMLGQRRRDKRAAARLLRKLLKNQGIHPEAIVTDRLGSYGAAATAVGLAGRHAPGGLPHNNRAENAHRPIRQRSASSGGSRARDSAQRFRSTHGTVYNTFNLQPHPISRAGLRTVRAGAHAVWANATKAA
jgi:putative transposase